MSVSYTVCRKARLCHVDRALFSWSWLRMLQIIPTVQERATSALGFKHGKIVLSPFTVYLFYRLSSLLHGGNNLSRWLWLLHSALVSWLQDAPTS